MAFNKVCMVLIAVFALASMANANAHPMFPLLHRPAGAIPWPTLPTYECQVKVTDDGVKKYYLEISQVGGCPEICPPKNCCFPYIIPPMCGCSTEVEKCHPGSKTTLVA